MAWIKTGWFAALIDRHGNGATRVVTHYNSYLKSRLKYLCTPFPHDKVSGFLDIAVSDLNTYGFGIYQQIVRDPKAMAQLAEARLSPCFDFDPARAVAPGGAVARRLKESGAACDGFGPGTPEYFIHVTMACTEVRHCGGVGEKIGDEDAFNLLAARGFLLHHNFGRLCDIRREVIGRALWRILGLGVAVTALRLVAPAETGTVSVPFLAGSGLAVVALAWQAIHVAQRLEGAKAAFAHVTDRICQIIAACIHKRQDALIANVDNTVAALKDGDHMQHWSRRTLLRWARQARSLGRLLDWFEKRIEGVKTYAFCTAMQTQMVVPSLLRRHKHEAEKMAHRFLLAGLPALLAAGGLDLALRLSGMSPVPPGSVWNDIALGGFLAIAAGTSAWLLAKLAERPDHDIAWEDILHDDALSALKGPAEAGVTEKRAGLYEDGHFRDIHDDGFGFPPDDDDDDPGGNGNPPPPGDGDEPHPLI